MATHSSILAWRIPWMEETGRLHHGVPKSRKQLSDFTFLPSKYSISYLGDTVLSKTGIFLSFLQLVV